MATRNEMRAIALSDQANTSCCGWAMRNRYDFRAINGALADDGQTCDWTAILSHLNERQQAAMKMLLFTMVGNIHMQLGQRAQEQERD